MTKYPFGITKQNIRHTVRYINQYGTDLYTRYGHIYRSRQMSGLISSGVEYAIPLHNDNLIRNPNDRGYPDIISTKNKNIGVEVKASGYPHWAAFAQRNSDGWLCYVRFNPYPFTVTGVYLARLTSEDFVNKRDGISGGVQKMKYRVSPTGLNKLRKGKIY